MSFLTTLSLTSFLQIYLKQPIRDWLLFWFPRDYLSLISNPQSTARLLIPSTFSINLQTSNYRSRSPASLLHNILICLYYLKNTKTRNHLLKQVRNKVCGNERWQIINPTHSFSIPPLIPRFTHLVVETPFQEFSELTKNFSKNVCNMGKRNERLFI